MANKIFILIILGSSFAFAGGPSIGYIHQKRIELNLEKKESHSCSKKKNEFIPHKVIKI